MKKNITKSLMALALMMVFAGPAFAANATNGEWTDPTDHAAGDVLITDANGVGPGIKFENLKFSTGVSFIYKGAESAFTIATNNSKGTRTFATASNASKMYVHKDDGQTAKATIPAAATDTSFDTTVWSEVGK